LIQLFEQFFGIFFRPGDIFDPTLGGILDNNETISRFPLLHQVDGDLLGAAESLGTIEHGIHDDKLYPLSGSGINLRRFPLNLTLGGLFLRHFGYLFFIFEFITAKKGDIHRFVIHE